MNDHGRKIIYRGGGGSWLYLLGLIGAMIFYIQESTGFWSGVVGVLKALVWPVFVVYDLLKFISG